MPAGAHQHRACPGHTAIRTSARPPFVALRRAARVAGLVAIALGPGAAPAAAQLDDPARDTRITRLENGLTVLTLVDRSTPVVSLQMWVKVGSRDETRYTGLAHLFEHMMFRGTDRLPPESHERLIQARGGRVNAFTTRDVTVYYEDLPADALPLAIDLEAERLRNLRVTEETLASERQVVLEERRLRIEDQPQGRAFEALLALTFPAHPYRVPVIGWASDVAAVDVEACRRFFRTYYAPNNIVLSVAGAFDEEQVLERIRAAFGGLEPAPSVPRNPTAVQEQHGERRQLVYYDVRSPIFTAAWHAPPTGHRDAEPLDVASLVLSGGRSSRLYRRLVYDSQQALAATGSYWELLEAGVFYAYATVRPDGHIDRVEELLMEEIERLREEPVPPDELAKAKRQIEVDLVGRLDTAHALASRIARDWVSFGRIRPLEERLEAFRAVTAEDVQRVARTYLTEANRNVVRVVPRPDPAEDAR